MPKYTLYKFYSYRATQICKVTTRSYEHLRCWKDQESLRTELQSQANNKQLYREYVQQSNLNSKYLSLTLELNILILLLVFVFNTGRIQFDIEYNAQVNTLR